MFPFMACAGQNISQIDSLFVGDILGKKSDIADGSLRDYEFRKFENIVGDYWIAEKFLDQMGVGNTCPYCGQSGCDPAKCSLSIC